MTDIDEFNQWNYGFSMRYGNPTFDCPVYDDLYTPYESFMGTRSLSYPVGLITADEVNFAGSNNTSTFGNEKFYLYTGYEYWTISPYYNGIYMYIVNMDGHLDYGHVESEYSIRPVINLKRDVRFTVADTTKDYGTWDNPYIVLEY